MNDAADLERRYRRLLACYPRAFRREHEQEMLSVLMAGTADGQQRPRPGEAANLITTAIGMRLSPRAPRSQPTVAWAVRLMYICAALALLGVPILPAARGSTPHPVDIGLSWGVFAVLAWANGRGYGWAGVIFTVWVGFHTVALFDDIAHGSASSTPVWAVIASVVCWLVEFSAVALILSKPSGAYYRHKPAQT